MWKAHLTMEVLSINDQCVTLAITRDSKVSRVMYVIYASPVAKYKEELWTFLS